MYTKQTRYKSLFKKRRFAESIAKPEAAKPEGVL